MKRLLVIILALLILAPASFAPLRRTVDEEKTRFETLLKYAETLDPPSRHTAKVEMEKFGDWVEPDLLGRLAGASVHERVLFLTVLYDRHCRAVLEPALKILPDAIERVRVGQIAAHEYSKINRQIRQATKDGNNALVDQLQAKADEEKAKVLWADAQRGDEVTIICFICGDFGKEDVLKKFVEIAMQSSEDDALGKGFETKFSRTHRDKLLPGGTEMWNIVYNPVWEALRQLAKRALDLKVMAAERQLLEKHFDKYDKMELGPNQNAAYLNYKAVHASMLKTEKKTGGDGENTEEEENNGDDGGGGGGDPDVKIIKG